MRALTIYLYPLASHVVKQYLRQSGGLPLILSLTGRALLYGLLTAIAFAAGYGIDVLLTTMSIDQPAGELIQHHLMHGLLIVLGVTVMSASRSRLDAAPYRHLPLSPYGMASVSAAIGLIRMPLTLFLAAVVGIYYGGRLDGESICLLAALGAAASLAGTCLRRTLNRHPRRFYVICGAAALLLGLDAVTGFLVAASSAFLDAESAIWPLLGAFLAAIAAFVIATYMEAEHIRYPVLAGAIHRGSAGHLEFATEKHPVLRIALLELRLLRRCAYPRYQLRGITVLLALLIVMASLSPDDLYRIVTMLFVVAGLSVTYAQLAFAWNSDHFDGLFALPISAMDHVRARWVVCAILTGAPAILMLAVILLLDLGSPLELLACSVLTIGWLIAPLMMTSILWSKPVALEGSGIENLKAYSWPLYAAIFGLWVSMQLLFSLTSTLTATLVVLGLGAVGLLLQPFVVRRVAYELAVHIPAMAERYRLKS